jgi:predicted CopG family antitoxin
MKSIFRKWFGSEPKNVEKQENTNEPRKLVKNPETGKYEWTLGESPLPTTVEELSYDNKQTIEVTDLKYLPEIPEYIVANFFVVNIPGVDPKTIRSFSYNGPASVVKSRTTSKAKRYDSSTVEIYLSKDNYEKLLKLKKGNSLGDITVAVLDRLEKPVFSIMLKSAKVESVHFPIYLQYKNDDVLVVYLEIKHDEIKYSI